MSDEFDDFDDDIEQKEGVFEAIQDTEDRYVLKALSQAPSSVPTPPAEAPRAVVPRREGATGQRKAAAQSRARVFEDMDETPDISVSMDGSSTQEPSLVIPGLFQAY